MVRRPDLGYRDEGLDFSDPDSFAPQRRAFGKASPMPRAVFRSMQFLYLEDEALWTREWIPVGTVHEIPGEGDALPFTLGYHGVHLQRMGPDSFESRFNLAQHGGCRVVPAQCQQGKRTKCSFTSCGYSRDGGPISASEGHDDMRTIYQFLGLRPERLNPVQIGRVGPLMFLNIDPDPEMPVPRATELPASLAAASLTRFHREWSEFKGNWKFAAQALGAVDSLTASSPRVMSGVRVGLTGCPLTVHWLFPNTVILSAGADICIVVLQHTAIDETLFRVEILSTGTMTEARRDMWRDEIAAAGARAEALQRDVPKKPELDGHVARPTNPLQSEAAAWWFQNVLTDRIAAMPKVESDVPIFRNVEHYLI